jgi:hypothetical protein
VRSHNIKENLSNTIDLYSVSGSVFGKELWLQSLADLDIAEL